MHLPFTAQNTDKSAYLCVYIFFLKDIFKKYDCELNQFINNNFKIRIVLMIIF